MLFTIIIFILILGVLVFVHELGHFLTARKAGIKVEEFGLGFPPRLFGIKKGETLYSVNLIPLGGFVRIKGEDGSLREEPDSFGHQPFYVKGLVLAAGVIMNVILAYVLLSIGYMVGLPTGLASEDLNSPNVSNVQLRIVGVKDGSVAQAASLTEGDVILGVDGNNFFRQDEFSEYIKNHQDQLISLKIQKLAGDVLDLQLQPALTKDSGENKILGVNVLQTGLVRYGFFASWYHGLLSTGNLLARIVMAFYGLLAGLFIGSGMSAELSGPVGVAMLTGQAVNLGFSYVLQFAAMLSLNLAVINFFPFPALDGGRFLFAVIEKIRRKPNNQNMENIVHNLGFSVLMILIVLITYRDINMLTGFVDKIKNLF
ncbi:MAG: site-2 protease family protein [Patescibacteria group bacterium]|jgi:regulator of sigma E protease